MMRSCLSRSSFFLFFFSFVLATALLLEKKMQTQVFHANSFENIPVFESMVDTITLVSLSLETIKQSNASKSCTIMMPIYLLPLICLLLGSSLPWNWWVQSCGLYTKLNTLLIMILFELLGFEAEIMGTRQEIFVLKQALTACCGLWLHYDCSRPLVRCRKSSAWAFDCLILKICGGQIEGLKTWA